jgi:hypothetical protein
MVLTIALGVILGAVLLFAVIGPAARDLRDELRPSPAAIVTP